MPRGRRKRLCGQLKRRSSLDGMVLRLAGPTWKLIQIKQVGLSIHSIRKT
jgi:hypothetical protein